VSVCIGRQMAAETLPSFPTSRRVCAIVHAPSVIAGVAFARRSLGVVAASARKSSEKKMSVFRLSKGSTIPELRLFECDIDRSETALPDQYLPDAPGVMIAGSTALKAAADYCSRSDHRRGWLQKNQHTFRRALTDGDGILQVRQFGEFWALERFDPNHHYTLVFAFFGRPIWTRSSDAAMQMADYCYPIPQPPIAGFWKRLCD
jgi:hypothetical protein